MINDPDNSPPSAQTAEGEGADKEDGDSGWLRLARSAFHTSVQYVENNYRKNWDDSLRAFNNQHTADSKYSQPAYGNRSKLFRPKTRSVIRRNEAAAAAAFFSNMDVVSVSPTDPNNVTQAASAEVNKALLNYRLTKTIPWFQTVLGGLQDAQSVGVCIAHVYWRYTPAPMPEELEEVAEDEGDEDEEYPKQGKLPDGAFVVEREPVVEIDIIPAAVVAGPIPMGSATAKPPSAPPPPAAPQPQAAQMAPPAALNVPPRPAQPVPQGLAAQGAPKPPMNGMPGPAPAPGAAPTPSPAPTPGAAPALGGAPMPGAAPAPGAAPMQGAAPQPPEKPKGPKPLEDRPVIDLIPVENFLIDPAADWADPVNTSPFIIHMMPMYLMDVKMRMESGEWRPYGDGTILAATRTKYDSTRQARMNRDDPYNPDSKNVSDYETCWVQRHIHRRDGVDWEFYMLGDQALLSDPRPLKESVFHGERPYVMGCCILETHKVYPASVPSLGKELQTEANEIANQRMDNVKFVLNKKWFVKRGKEADLAGLVRNVPGGVVMMDDPQNDVREVTWPDVTQSAYEEQSRVDNDLNDLLGNFSVGQVMADKGVNGPARNMAMLNQSSGTLVEYLLRTFVETFVQPVLRQLVKLEQFYETDQTALAVASSYANLRQKFGVDEVTDELLEQDLNLTVNVGMGATDPQMKLSKFMGAMTAYLGMLQHPAPGINMKEVGKEIFGHMGYQDGARFLTNEDPATAQLKQQLQQAMQQIQQMQAKLDEKQTSQVVRQKIADMNNQTKIAVTKIHEDNQNLRSAITHKRALVDNDKDRQHDAVMHGLKSRADASAQAQPVPMPAAPAPIPMNQRVPQ